MAEHPTTFFQEKVYNALRKVPEGKVITYKELAEAIGCKSPRAIGQAMRHNPYAPIVPCHRVVASDGSIGGFSGRTSGSAIDRKVALLRKEGVKVKEGVIQNFKDIAYHFDE